MAALGATPDKAALLGATGLLRHLAPDGLRALALHTRIVRYRDRRTIFHKGDPGSSMLVVVGGHVRITSSSASNRGVTLNTIGPGEVLGEIGLLDGEPRSCDAVASGDVELLVLDRRDFVPFLERHHDVCLRLMGVLCQRLRQTTDQVEDLVFLDHTARLAKTLLRLARAGGSGAGAPLVVGPLTQGDLGAVAGMRREFVNRQLRDWQASGVLVREGRRITIADPAALQRIAGAHS